MIPKRRPGRPPKNLPMQTLPYGSGANKAKVASPPVPLGNIESGAAIPAAAAATPKASGSKAETQPMKESESEAANEGGRSHESRKRARTEDTTEEDQSPKALSSSTHL